MSLNAGVRIAVPFSIPQATLIANTSVEVVANSATKGTRYADDATLGHASRLVKAGDRIQVKPTSFATAGALDGFLFISTADTSPAL